MHWFKRQILCFYIAMTDVKFDSQVADNLFTSPRNLIAFRLRGSFIRNVFFVPPFIDICLVLYAWNENTSMLWSDKALLTKYKLSFVEIHA